MAFRGNLQARREKLGTFVVGKAFDHTPYGFFDFEKAWKDTFYVPVWFCVESETIEASSSLLIEVEEVDQ